MTQPEADEDNGVFLRELKIAVRKLKRNTNHVDGITGEV